MVKKKDTNINIDKYNMSNFELLKHIDNLYQDTPKGYETIEGINARRKKRSRII